MSRTWFVVAVLGVAAAVAVSLVALPRGSEWTTDSPEARAELDAAIEAMMKLYHDEVQGHLERAVELDPDFAIAKLLLAEQLRYDDEDRALRLWNEVLRADLETLSPREVFLIERNRAYQEKRHDDAEKMVDDYLAKYPDDPFVLHQKALRAWRSARFEEAERLNRRLVEIAPNWVIAYNQLGYIAMSQGRFVEAEEYFTSYRFVAPDQANPHDSLGELYIILGRHEEAEASLRRSLEIKPDFWAAYDHLVLSRLMVDDFAGAEAVLAEARAVGGFPDYWDVGIGCTVSIAALSEAERWSELLELLGDDSPCLEGHAAGIANIARHRAACRLGDLAIAEAIEQGFEKSFGAAEQVGKTDTNEILVALKHLEGERLAVTGDLAGAIEAFRTADENATYIQAGNGIFKLVNRLYLVEALFAAGDDAEAHKVLSQVRAVNPTLVREFGDDGLKILRLDRD
jgi:Flp pilus assembly protein TadD